MEKAVVFEDYSDFVKQSGVSVVKYFLTSCPPCRILKPTFEKFVNEGSVRAMEVCLNDFKKEQLPHIEKAPSVEFFKDGVSLRVLQGKELCLAKLNEALQGIQ
jgi:thiol-disulfide isomerase/thioredoxin